MNGADVIERAAIRVALPAKLEGSPDGIVIDSTGGHKFAGNVNWIKFS